MQDNMAWGDISESTYLTLRTQRRAMDLSQEESSAGNELVSVETCPDQGHEHVRAFVEEHFGQFRKMISPLPEIYQDYLYCYLVVGKSQVYMGKVWKCTQTMISSRIRQAQKVLGALMLFQGDPTAHIDAVIAAEGLQDAMDGHLGDAIRMYADTHSFETTGLEFGLPKGTVKIALTEASRTLLSRRDMRAQGMGAWLQMHMEIGSDEMKYSARRLQGEAADIYMVDPDECGQFAINLSSPGWDKVLAARADN